MEVVERKASVLQNSQEQSFGQILTAVDRDHQHLPVVVLKKSDVTRFAVPPNSLGTEEIVTILAP